MSNPSIMQTDNSMPNLPGTDNVAGTGTALGQALGRLARSRARLQASLAPAPAADNATQAGGFHPLMRARAWLRKTPWGGLIDPVLSAASQELMHWWQRQPWRQSLVLARDTLSSELSPLVRRHPISAVLLTAAAAAALAGSGVWRWHTVRRSAWQLGSRMRRLAIDQISSPALLSVLLGAVISTIAAKRQPASGNSTASQSPDAANEAATGNESQSSKTR